MSTPHERSRAGLGNTEGFKPVDGSKTRVRKAPKEKKVRTDGFNTGTFDASKGVEDKKKK